MTEPPADARAATGRLTAAEVGTPSPALLRDRESIRRWQQGDAEAGAALMDRYAEFVRVVARRGGIRDERDHLDLWQELLLRLLQRLPDLHTRIHSSFAGYLAWQVRDLATSMRSRPAPASAASPEPASADADELERAEFWRAVRDCEAALPPGERAVFQLRFRDGLRVGEIAVRTASTANAVSQSLFRLVRRMRTCLRLRGHGLSEAADP